MKNLKKFKQLSKKEQKEVKGGYYEAPGCGDPCPRGWKCNMTTGRCVLINQ